MVVVIEARRLIRESLAASLRVPGGEHEVASFASAAEWRRLRPDPPRPGTVVLRYLEGPFGLRDIEREIGDLSCEGKVSLVLLSDTEEVEEMLEAIAAGAKGYIPTTLGLDVARSAISLVRSGGVFIPSASLLSRRAGGAGHARSPQRFTPRQAAVLEAVRHGKANKVIAYELALKESTVKVHVRNVMRKLGAHNRTELAILSFGLPAHSR